MPQVSVSPVSECGGCGAARERVPSDTRSHLVTGLSPGTLYTIQILPLTSGPDHRHDRQDPYAGTQLSRQLWHLWMKLCFRSRLGRACQRRGTDEPGGPDADGRRRPPHGQDGRRRPHPSRALTVGWAPITRCLRSHRKYIPKPRMLANQAWHGQIRCASTCSKRPPPSSPRS